MKKLAKVFKRPTIVFTALAAALLLIISSFFSFRSQIDMYIADEMRSQIDALQENATLLIQNEMNYLKRVTASLAQMVSSKNIESDEDIVKTLQLYAETSNTARMYFVTLDGELYTSYAGYQGQSEKNTNIDGIDLLEVTGPVFSQAHYSEALDEVIYGVIAPTIMGGKQGVLVSSYNISDFSTLLENKFIEGSASIGIVNSKGEVILGKSNEEFKYNIFDSLNEIYFVNSSAEAMQNNLLKGNSGFSIYRVNGIGRYCSYAPIGMNDWNVIVLVEEGILYNKLINLEQYGFELMVKLVIIMTVLLLVIMLSWLGYQKKLRVILEKAARLDGLTGIYNRKAIEEIIEGSLKQSKRHTAVLLALDIDNFKQINDQQGHQFGDYVLRECASRLTSVFSDEGKTGRVGGDEFVVFLNECNDIEVVKKKISRLLEEFIVDTETGEKYKVSLSVGIAQETKDINTFALLYQHADAALYRAKQKGKGRFSD